MTNSEICRRTSREQILVLFNFCEAFVVAPEIKIREVSIVQIYSTSGIKLNAAEIVKKSTINTKIEKLTSKQNTIII